MTLNIAVDEIRARNSSELACLLYERQINTAKGAVEEERLYEAVTRLEGAVPTCRCMEKHCLPCQDKPIYPRAFGQTLLVGEELSGALSRARAKPVQTCMVQDREY